MENSDDSADIILQIRRRLHEMEKLTERNQNPTEDPELPSSLPKYEYDTEIEKLSQEINNAKISS